MSTYKPDMKTLEYDFATCQAVEEELVNLQCNRTGLSKVEWRKLADKGESDAKNPILTREAKSLGIIDKILASFPIF